MSDALSHGGFRQLTTFIYCRSNQSLLFHRSLDLSYNSLCGTQLSQLCRLASLPQLAELQLSSCRLHVVGDLQQQQQQQDVRISPTLRTLGLNHNTINGVALSALLACAPQVHWGRREASCSILL